MPRNIAFFYVALALLVAGAARCARLHRDRDEDPAFADAGQKQKLRHSRFEKLDSIFTKLSELNAGAEASEPITTRPPEPDEPEEGRRALDDDYEDEEDYDEMDEAHGLENLSEEQQLEAIVSKLLQPDQWIDSDIAADDAEDDWQDNYGEYQNSQPESSTRKRHEESSSPRVDRNSYMAAANHYWQMTTAGKCSVPQPRVVSVQLLYPHTSKTYYPHCTILHQCSDDTGCCMNDYLTCAPKKTKQIDLSFIVKSLDGVFVKVENLKFDNHTECECVGRQIDLMTKDVRNHLPHYQPSGVYHSSETETESPLTLRRCKCPSEFSVHILENGECRCNCFNRQRGCLRLKRGLEYLGLRDRLCIQNHECEQPNCEFGTYVLKAGRCPRRREQVERRLHYAGRIF